MTSYVGQIVMVGFTFAPPGYLVCDGSLQSISNYDVLFTLLGTTFGGDGQSTFALPDLRGRVPVHQGTHNGTSYVMGMIGGATSVTLTTQQMTAHTHPVVCNNNSGGSPTPTGAYFAGSAESLYGVAGTPVAMGSQVSVLGGSQPHDNLQPYLTVTYLIATAGIYPSQP